MRREQPLSIRTNLINGEWRVAGDLTLRRGAILAHVLPIDETDSNFPARPCCAWAPENKKKGKVC